MMKLSARIIEPDLKFLANATRELREYGAIVVNNHDEVEVSYSGDESETDTFNEIMKICDSCRLTMFHFQLRG